MILYLIAALLFILVLATETGRLILAFLTVLAGVALGLAAVALSIAYLHAHYGFFRGAR